MIALTIIACTSSLALVGLSGFVVLHASRERAGLVRAIIAKSPSDMIRLEKSVRAPERAEAIGRAVDEAIGMGEYFDESGKPVVPMGFAGA